MRGFNAVYRYCQGVRVLKRSSLTRLTVLPLQERGKRLLLLERVSLFVVVAVVAIVTLVDGRT